MSCSFCCNCRPAATPCCCSCFIPSGSADAAQNNATAAEHDPHDSLWPFMHEYHHSTVLLQHFLLLWCAVAAIITEAGAAAAFALVVVAAALLLLLLLLYLMAGLTSAAALRILADTWALHTCRISGIALLWMGVGSR